MFENYTQIEYTVESEFLTRHLNFETGMHLSRFINKNKTPVFMKLSDKALKLIGRHILGSMDNSTNQDDSKPTIYTRPATGNYRPRLNLRDRIRPSKAPVLPFRKKTLNP